MNLNAADTISNLGRVKMETPYDGHTTQIEGTFSSLHSQMWHDVPHNDKRIILIFRFPDNRPGTEGEMLRIAARPTPDEALQFAIGILRDVSLAKFGEG